MSRNLVSFSHFARISLHPPVSGLYNFSPEVERAEKSAKKKRNFCTRVYRNCEHVDFSLRYDEIWLGEIGNRNKAKLHKDFWWFPVSSIRLHLPSLNFAMLYLRKTSGRTHDANNGAIFHDTCTGCSKIIRRCEGCEEQTGNNEIWKWNISRKGSRREIRDLREEIVVYPVISSKRTFIFRFPSVSHTELGHQGVTWWIIHTCQSILRIECLYGTGICPIFFYR